MSADTLLKSIESTLRSTEGIDVASLGSGALPEAIARRRAHEGLSLAELAARVGRDAGIRAALVAELLVHETSFFRYPASFDHLARLAAERTSERPGSFRVLSAGCSTGQEPYSAAIAMLEAGVPEDRVDVEALDLSATAVERAKRGVFDRAGLRGLSAERRERWTTPVEDGWRVRDEVLARVRFAVTNLLARGPALGHGPFDAVFCRNLLIYCVPDARHRVLDRLRASLDDGGVLYLGHAEVLVARSEGFAPVDARGVYAAVRADPAARAASSAAATPTAGMSSPTRDARPSALSLVPAPADPSQAASPTASRARSADATPAKPSSATLGGSSLDAARRHADAGRTSQARSLLEADLSRGIATADHFHLLAVLHRADGRPGDADEALVRALYLDPAHAGALLLSSIAADERGQRAVAARLRARARAAAPRAT